MIYKLTRGYFFVKARESINYEAVGRVIFGKNLYTIKKGENT